MSILPLRPGILRFPLSNRGLTMTTFGLRPQFFTQISVCFLMLDRELVSAAASWSGRRRPKMSRLRLWLANTMRLSAFFRSGRSMSQL